MGGSNLKALDWHELPRPLDLDKLPRWRLREHMSVLGIREPHQSRKADLVALLEAHESKSAAKQQPYHVCTKGCGTTVYSESEFTRLFGWRNDLGHKRRQPQCRKCRAAASKVAKAKARARKAKARVRSAS